MDDHGQYVMIKKSEYERLKDSEDMLECLRAAGVDNWIGWDEAMKMYNEDKEVLY